AGVAVICTVTYFSVFKKQPPKENNNDKIVTTRSQNTNTNDTKLHKAFIAPPISKLDVPYTSYKVKAEQGGTIKHHSNSKIIIPKKAFVNKQGQDIIGDVEIKYREFHNQADIIASGIPMTYDSAGVQSHFESAGMIDIKGYQNGEPVFIKPEKQITVEFQSEHTTDKYNMYELDTVVKNWTYLGRDNSLKNKSKFDKQSSKDVSMEDLDFDGQEKSDKLISIKKQIDAIPPKIETEKVAYTKKVNQLPKASEPVKPNKAIAGRPQFELDVNYKEFPELEAFKNAVFEVGAENKNYNSKLADITWSSAEVSEGPQKGKNYLLTLKLRERVEKLIVYPALTGADYDKALKSYESKFSDYKNLVAKREADEKKLREEFEAKQAVYLAEQKKLNEEYIREKIRWQREQQAKQMSSITQDITAQSIVIRVFNISNFGIFNSDCPNSLPQGASINPQYVNNESTIIPSSVYLVCHNKNLVYNLPYGTLKFNPRDSYSLCLISNGKMFLCSKESFASIAASKQNKIPLTELSNDVNDALDLKKAIGI
ncbi:MAG: hypothetical protein HY062_16985, partial [Bacteroidetes bacterium]|nr:hypothetical protein [Bacteroidota bacterium]